MLQETIEALKKKFGRDNIVRSGSEILPIRRVPIKLPVYNVLSGGGSPINRIIELWGENSSGKTLQAILNVAAFQRYDWASGTPWGIDHVEYERVVTRKKAKKKGDADGPEEVEYKVTRVVPAKGITEPRLKKVAYIDYEHTFDPVWAEKHGVDMKGLLYFIPSSASEGVDIAQALIMDPELSLLVIDAIGAVGSDFETETSMEDEQMASNAKFWNKALRKIQAAMNYNPEQDVTIIVVNRPYSKVGRIMGSPEEIGGGGGIKFGKSLSVRSHACPFIKDSDESGGDILGRFFELTIKKNKTGSTDGKKGKYFMSFDGVIDYEGQIMDIAIDQDVVMVAGAWYSYQPTKGDFIKIQGKESFTARLIELNLMKEIESKLK